MAKRGLDGRFFTVVLSLVFAVFVYFAFWAPNRDVALALVERRSEEALGEEQQGFTLWVRVVREDNGQEVPWATVEWSGAGDAAGSVRAGKDGLARLQLPSLGRYRLRVPAAPERGFGAVEIPYRYKVGADRADVRLPVPQIRGEASLDQ